MGSLEGAERREVAVAVVVLVGAQWGDEGKGKVVEIFMESAGLLVHYAGGGNPGQTLVVEGDRLVFDVVPAGPLRRGKTCLMAQGMALDPTVMLEELDALETHGALQGELMVCQRAHVILPHHVEIDWLRHETEGASGRSRRGIGPCYADKVARRGVQMGDLTSNARFETKLRESIAAADPVLRALGGEPPEVGPILERYLACGEKLASKMVDGSRYVRKAIGDGEDLLLEGCLGTMVDIDQGAYPFVVAASTVAGGACTGVGIAPRSVGKVIGVAKAYTTRSGQGPFPTELGGDLAAKLVSAGGEISPATARPRRCGMFGVPELRYAARVNGFDAFAMTKLDVLSGIDEIPVCMAYELDGEEIDEPPFEGLSRAKPVLEMLPGWSESLGDCRHFEDLPENAQRYVKRIAEKAELEVTAIGVGPDRSETIVLNDPFR